MCRRLRPVRLLCGRNLHARCSARGGAAPSGHVDGGLVDGEGATAVVEAVPLCHRSRAPDEIVDGRLGGAAGVHHGAPKDEVLHRRGEAGRHGVQEVRRRGVRDELEDRVPDGQHEREVALSHLGEVGEHGVGVRDLHGVGRIREDPGHLVSGLRVELPGIPAVDDGRHALEGPEVAAEDHPRHTAYFDDAGPVQEGLDVRSLELREERVVPEVPTCVLPEGQTLQEGIRSPGSPDRRTSRGGPKCRP